MAATAGDNKIKVAWDPPVSDGGSPITGYTITASPGTRRTSRPATGPAAHLRRRSGGPANGKTYTITVVAKNANGTGAASPKVSVTLDDVEPPPTTTTTAPPADGDPLGGAGADDDGPATTAASRSGYWLLDAHRRRVPLRRRGAVRRRVAAKLAAAGSGSAGRRPSTSSPRPLGQGYWVLDGRGRVPPSATPRTG